MGLSSYKELDFEFGKYLSETTVYMKMSLIIDNSIYLFIYLF